ncbi:MAG: prepilin-type N-terminal cleavage/methylation domain-containing protein [Polyangiaceae bacterium]
MRNRRGYSMIEVLSAITIFGVGAAGVIAMQRTSIKGNYDARALDQATSITREWNERLRRDAAFWTVPATLPTEAQWLTTSNVALANAASLPAWFTPTVPAASPAGLSPAFDLLGRDLTFAEATGTNSQAVFCTQIRLQRINASLIRSEIRVSWMRAGGTLSCQPGFAVDDTLHRTLYVVNTMRGNF